MSKTIDKKLAHAIDLAVKKITKQAKPKSQAKEQHKPKPKQKSSPVLARTFDSVLETDGLNKALQMHNNSAIVDHFPRLEKVMDIIPTSLGFSHLANLYLNPGNSSLFPIFSRIAANYEQYKCRYLKFHYVSEAYTASGSNLTAGKVIMATNVDPDSGAFASATEAENYPGSDRAAPFTNLTHDSFKKKRGKSANAHMPLTEYFVYSSFNSGAPINEVTKFYDMGHFEFMTSGLPSGAIGQEYGELYVEFQFDMIRPLQLTNAGSLNDFAFIEGFPALTSTASNPWGNSGPVSEVGTNLPLKISSTSPSSVLFPTIGLFWVCLMANNPTAVSTITRTLTGSALGLAVLFNDSTSYVNGLGSSNLTATLNFFIQVVNPGYVDGFTFTSTGMTAGNTNMLVVRIPSNTNGVLEKTKLMSMMSELDQFRTRCKPLMIPNHDDDDFKLIDQTELSVDEVKLPIKKTFLDSLSSALSYDASPKVGGRVSSHTMR